MAEATMAFVTLTADDARYPARLRERLGVDAPEQLFVLGNLDLLALPKTALFCSVRCPGQVILTVYDQAARWREEAGRRDEALEQIEENLSRFSDDVWIVIKAGSALHELNEADRAIELLQRAYEMSEPMSYDRDGVLKRLVPLLHDKQRHDEADALVAKDRESRKPVRPAQTAKIGRNEPCHYGSGKKHKKCCLGREV